MRKTNTNSLIFCIFVAYKPKTNNNLQFHTMIPISTIPPTTIMRYTFLMLLGLFLIGCSEEKRSMSLNESEVFFEETLASISKDHLKDNIFYIGTEDGIVYIYNSENQHLEKITTAFDRIYKIVRDSAGNYWIGTRNMGLFCCDLKGDSLCVKKRHGRFYIPLKSKKTQYSAYDISVHNSTVYVATSHGLYYVPKETDVNDSTLTIIFPSRYKDAPENICPVGTRSIQPYKNQYLFCASDSGLLRVNLSNNNVEKLFSRKTHNVAIHDDSICSLVGDSLLVTDIDGKPKESYALKLPAQIYYYDKTEGTNYFISNHYIQLVKDKDLKNPDKFMVVPSQKSIRTKCRNIIEKDLSNRRSLLVTVHSVSRVGHHQDVFNSDGNVRLACTDDDNIYYLIGTKVYRQKKGETEATQFKDIPKGVKDISFMEVLNDTLYYVDANHEIYKAKLYSNYFLNSILSWDHIIRQNPKSKFEVTAIGKDAENVYVGVRDGFRNINNINKNIPLADPTTKETIKDPFITKFASNGDQLLFCTLNDGVFFGKNNSFTRTLKGSAPYTFIRDMGIDSLQNVKHILTNRGYFIINNDSSFTKEAELSGYNRLLVLDSTHVYGIPSFGITNLCDSLKRYFIDIQFNPMACLVFDNKVIAGSSNGVYVFSTDLSKENSIETAGTYYRVKFNDQNYFSRTNILIFIIVIVSIIIGLWWHDRYKMSRHAVRTFKDGLVLRLNELNSVREHLDTGTTTELDGLISEVESVDISGKKIALAQLRNISLRIMKLTGKVPSMLIQILQEQIREIKKSGLDNAANQIDKTNKAIKNHTLSSLSNQIKENSQWLSGATSTLSILSSYKSLFSKLPLIPEVTDEISKILHSAASPDKKIANIEKLSRKINDKSSKDNIKEYIDKKIKECGTAQSDFFEKSMFHTTLGLIKDNYLDIKNRIDAADDMTELMKLIFIIDRQLSIFLVLWEIRNLLPKYDEANTTYEKKIKKIDNREKEGKYALKGEANRKKDEDEGKKLLGALKEISSNIIKNIDELYKIFASGSEMTFLKKLGISIKESNGGQFMQANLLALLMTGTNIPVSRFRNLFEVNEQSLRRVKRDLVTLLESEKKTSIVIEYAQNNETSIAGLILELKDMVSDDRRQLNE